ncbi:hypothetical protein D3C74_364850 [compost metagenome]
MERLSVTPRITPTKMAVTTTSMRNAENHSNENAPPVLAASGECSPNPLAVPEMKACLVASAITAFCWRIGSAALGSVAKRMSEAMMPPTIWASQ